MRYTLLFISLFFLACQEEKVPVYSDQDKINFIGTSEDNEDDPEFMFLEKKVKKKYCFLIMVLLAFQASFLLFYR